ncbi:hypothetical protein GALMADRAFT_127278 [Galerina marginata CBS 339.88]|uniref:Uncharacterized protein n=1 Tax=Galerina marginata (strain CBS 339.88) TaxID=685588 RepID=A0A067SJK2_GALM3|nr:hypothetical protein GALMADRAFT_127278 [Galerina marginata CBS 339.88]
MALHPDLQPIELPGFGLPLNHLPKVSSDDRHFDLYGGNLRRLFPNALNLNDIKEGRTILGLTTLREFTMLQIMNHITDKPKWHLKVFDETIVNKWKEEAKGSAEKDVSEQMVNYIVEELRYKAGVFAETGATSVYTGDVVKSDSAVPKSVKIGLQTAVKVLEDIPKKHKDWHPGSDEKVLDLVHPSLFPLIYGTTRVLERGKLSLEDCIARSGEGVIIPVPPEQEAALIGDSTADNVRMVKAPYSREFQWLPCEVDISGEAAKITSYINNLHPEKHRELYSLIEQVIDAAIPLWDMTLAPTVECNWNESLRLIYRRSWTTNDIIQPEPGPFRPPQNPPCLNLRRQFIDEGLQVIVKLANIELTPEKPEYTGGSWHVEGQLNEHICATALFYYSNENITTSKLAFRQQSNTRMTNDIYYEQDFHDWLPAVFGCRSPESSVQVIGGVDTREGRLLTFPNILQHQVQPFRLADPRKRGHRKILALFLVDPHIKVLSTANVPPQQKEWWEEKIRATETLLDLFPAELVEEIFDEVEDGCIFGLEKAKALRLALMEERKDFEVKHDGAFKSLHFSLCEH